MSPPPPPRMGCQEFLKKRIVKTKLFEDWTTWLEEENEVAAEKWQQRRFTENLLRKGITLGGQGRMQYIGIGLRSDRETV